MSLTEFLGRQNKAVLAAIGILLFGVVVLGDIASGPAFGSSVFYLVPVSFFGWFLGRRAGIATALLCAGAALAVHHTHFAILRPGVVYWNAVAWLSVYLFFVFIIAELRDLYRRERAWSHTDALTGMPNRRAFFERLQIEKTRAERYGSPLTLAYIDLDLFKQVNDIHGHATGDRLLSVVANVMQRELRQADAIGRLGGDEFAVLLPETNEVAAAAVLGKLNFALLAAMKKDGWPTTFSIGAATFQPPPHSVEAMLVAADNAMYEAKKDRRDRLVVRSAKT